MPTYSELQAAAEPARRRIDASEKARVAVGIDTSTIANGALETLAALREEAGRRGLEVNVDQTGGWGLNFADPVVEGRTPDGERLLYGNVSVEDVAAFVEAALVSREGREHWLLGALHGHAGDHVENMTDHAWWAIQERRLMADMGVIDPESADEAIARGA